MTDEEYAGDISPTEAWDMLQSNPNAVLIDTRTDAEFSYVGCPDLSDCPNPSYRISWKIFPDMQRNMHFEQAVREVSSDFEVPLLFLCRSGIRSKAAAIAMTALGYKHCYNIAEGFEGDKDDAGHRGTIGGWKVHGLPWVQG
jgi:rhodanese-related sulfurtransferase